MLLHPALAVVPFAGREAELSGLLGWCLTDTARPVKLLAGAGGVGKTRLALELEKQIKKRGWATIMLRPGGELGAVLAAQSRRPLLLIVDYAETRDDLDKLMETVSTERSAAGNGGSWPVRVLLLARYGGEWLARLRLSAGLRTAARDIVPVEAPDGTSGADVIKLEAHAALGWSADEEVRRAIPRFAEKLGVREVVGLPATLPDRDAGPDPGADTGAEPLLVLHAQALVYALRLADGEHPDTAPSPDQVVAELLTHERALWTQALAARGIDRLDQRSLDQAFAVLCLCPVRNAADAARLLAAAPALRGRDESFLDTLAWRLSELYPADPPAWWGSLAPDLIAEWLVAQVLTRSGDYEGRGLAREVIARVQDPAGRARYTDPDELAVNALGVLIRASRHHQAIAGHLTEIAGLPMSHATLRRFSELLPFPTTVLADVALVTARRVHDGLTESDGDAQAAGACRVLGVRLIQGGRSADGAEPLAEAVRLYRVLADQDPRYRERLASTLVDVGAVWLESDRPDLAAPALRESVANWRLLSAGGQAGRPGGRLVSLASALVNLGACLGEADDPAGAIESLSEAVAITGMAIAGDPQDMSAHRYRAAAQTNLGIYLRKLGRVDEAAANARAAVATLRALAETDRDKYLPDLASSLVNLARSLQENGRRGEELRVLEEAAQLFGELAKANPLRFRADYAGALLQVGIWYTLADRLPDAADPLAEAVLAYTEAVADEDSTELRVKLADAQMTLCTVVPVLGIPPRQEAVFLTAWLDNERGLVAAHPSRADKLASALSKYGRLLSSHGGDGAGLTELGEAITLYRHLGDGYQAALADALIDKGQALMFAKRFDLSNDFEEAVGLLRPLAAARPRDYLWNLAQAQLGLGGKYLAVGRPADAVLVLQDALDAAQRAEELRPGRLTGWAEIAFYMNLGTAWRLLDRPADTEPHLSVAISRWLELCQSDPRRRRGLPRAIREYADVLGKLGRRADADRYRAQADEIDRLLAADGETGDDADGDDSGSGHPARLCQAPVSRWRPSRSVPVSYGSCSSLWSWRYLLLRISPFRRAAHGRAVLPRRSPGCCQRRHGVVGPDIPWCPGMEVNDRTGPGRNAAALAWAGSSVPGAGIGRNGR